MRQSDSQRIRGWFFLPEALDDRVPGILTWEPSDGATLELIGGLSPEPKWRPNPDGSGLVNNQVVGDVRPGTIYGEIDGGPMLSIWDAQRGRYTAGFSGQVSNETWHASWICVGAHVASPGESEFSRATIVLDQLYYLTDDGRFCTPQWVKIDGVDEAGEKQANGTLLMPYTMPVVGGYRAEQECADTADARYSVNTTATRPMVSEAGEKLAGLKLDLMTDRQRRGPVIELCAGANASIRLPGDTLGGATDFVDRMVPILDLMRLATFSEAGVENIALKTADDKNLTLLSRIGEPASPEGQHRPAEVIFTFAEVSLDSYLTTRTKLTSSRQGDYAWSVVIGHCGYSPKFVEQYASQILAGAEGLHTWCFNGGEMDLKDRLRALHDMLPAEVQAQLNLGLDNWTDWAVWARNHVAHGGAKRKKFIKDGPEILAVARSVHVVTFLAVLTELGVPVGRITDALLNHPRLSSLVSSCEVVNQIQPPATA